MHPAEPSAVAPLCHGMQCSPFFCMMIHVTTYLNGLFSAASFLMQFSKQLDVHWLTCMGVRQRRLGTLHLSHIHASRSAFVLSRAIRQGSRRLPIVKANANMQTYLGFAVLLVLQHCVNGLLDDVAHVVRHEGRLIFRIKGA